MEGGRHCAAGRRRAGPMNGLMRRRSAAIAAILAAVSATLLLPAAPAEAAPGTDPAAWDKECDGVDLAGALSVKPDVDEDGTPVRIKPDARGRYVPVVMVHGWTSRSTHTDKRDGVFSALIDLTSSRFGRVDVRRSLIGQLQKLPGAAVFTFDYRRYAGRWVDDEEVGGALGAAIDCLHERSGERVIIVGHSMGGLAARFVAAQRGRNGVDRSAEISTVITFGTPHTGSKIAAAAAGLLDAPDLTAIRLILDYCGRVSSERFDSGSLCGTLPAFARAFSGEAGEALRAGSPQLARLAPFPKGVAAHALAGSTAFDLPKAGWFALPWDTERVVVGDVVVGQESAFSGVERTLGKDCAYQLNIVRGAVDRVGTAFRLIAVQDTARSALEALKIPCYHGNLMRHRELTNEAVGVVGDEIARRAPPNLAELARILDCIGTCDITGVVPVEHPTWGSVVVATTASTTDQGPATIYAVDSARSIRWFRAVADGSVPYQLAPVGASGRTAGYSRFAVGAPTDSTGNVFLNYNPGRHNGVIILRSAPNGFDDFSTIPPPADYAGRFYYAEAVDKDGDREFEIEQSANDCEPTCAEGKVSTKLYVWNGRDYGLR